MPASYGTYDGWKLATPWDDGPGPCAHGSGWRACNGRASEDCVCRTCGDWFCPDHYDEESEQCERCSELEEANDYE